MRDPSGGLLNRHSGEAHQQKFARFRGPMSVLSRARSEGSRVP
jgi:hypothetical protein